MFVKQITSDSLVIGAPAKVNLFLKVLGKRADGYHDISSLFQAVSLFDRLRFTRVDRSWSVSIELRRPSSLPTDQRNLIVRAYNLMRERFDLPGGLKVQLEKNIPVSAGLGGGSADAAATILACNMLFGLQLSPSAMSDLGLEIGSDVPFFFSRGQAMVGGRGEEITETDYPSDYWLVLVTPNLAISTAESYAVLSLGLTRRGHPIKLQSYGTTLEFAEALKLTENDFEKLHLKGHPQLGRIFKGLLTNGAVLARMSGSGPTVFGVYIGAPDLDGVKLFGRDDWQVEVVRPINLLERHP